MERYVPKDFRGIPATVPNIITDTNFFRGTDDGFGNNQMMRRIYHQRARAAGIDTTGKVYCPELVSRSLQGGIDPAAWVPRTEGRSHIKSVLERRRWSSTGRVEVKEPSYEIPDDPEPYVPADDILEKATMLDVERNMPDATPSERKKIKAANAKTLAGNMNDP